MKTPDRPLREIKALDLPMTPFAVTGLVLWALAGLVLLPFRDTLVADGRGNWLWVCLAGFLAGLPGLAHMIRHDRHRRQAGTEPDGEGEPQP